MKKLLQKSIAKLFQKFWPAIIITIVVFTFHIRTFIPESSMYITSTITETTLGVFQSPLNLTYAFYCNPI